VAAPVPPSSDSTVAYQPPPLKSPPQFVIIKAPLTFGDTQPGTNIPLGSTIYHWNKKITEVIGPDNSVLFICKDAEVAQVPTPGAGLQPVTNITQVPSGARIGPDNKNITQIYAAGNDLIGTIVQKPEDFPYAPTQLRNASQQYLVTGFFTDGYTSDITSQVIWNSSNPSIAEISSSGLVTALANGKTYIIASLEGIASLPVELTVNSLISISLSTWSGVGTSLAFTNLQVGSKWWLYAQGSYSDGSTAAISNEVTWISADSSVATVDSTGVITAVSDGNDKITATLSGITSTPIPFTVVSLTSIEVIGVPNNIAVGSKWTFSAKGTYNDGSTGTVVGVTWNSSDTTVAVFSEAVLTSLAAGTTSITASKNGIVSKPVILTGIANRSTSQSTPQ